MPTDQMQSVLVDPREAGPKPPYGNQRQPMPGSEQQMQPQADHGEQSYKGSGKLQGTAALITGADSGIGRAVAIAFAREGADVLISYLNEHDDARETARWVQDAGRKAVTVAGDITSQQHCEQLVDRTMNEFGRLDILVSNAAMRICPPAGRRMERGRVRPNLSHECLRDVLPLPRCHAEDAARCVYPGNHFRTRIHAVWTAPRLLLDQRRGANFHSVAFRASD